MLISASVKGHFMMSGYKLRKSIVLIGLMGSGKSSIGKRLSEKIGVSFIDSDEEIEVAAGMSITEIFETFGEAYFRSGEERVIKRILSGTPKVIATGGGVFMSKKNRTAIRQKSLSVWLKADLETLWFRVQGKETRPLLKVDKPKLVLRALLEERSATYGKADLIIDSKRHITQVAMVSKLINLLMEQKVLEFINAS